MSNSATPWTIAHQAPLSMGFLRPEYWSGVPFPSPGKLPDPGIEPRSPVLAGRFFTTEAPGRPNRHGSCSLVPNLGRGLLQVTPDSSCKGCMGPSQARWCPRAIGRRLGRGRGRGYILGWDELGAAAAKDGHGAGRTSPAARLSVLNGIML